MTGLEIALIGIVVILMVAAALMAVRIDELNKRVDWVDGLLDRKEAENDKVVDYLLNRMLSKRHLVTILHLDNDVIITQERFTP